MRQWIPTFLLFTIFIAFRLMASRIGLNNFTPLPAFLLCSLIFLRGSRQWILPALAWIISNPLMNFCYDLPLFGWNEFATLIGFVAALVLVPWVRKNPSMLRAQSSAIAAGLLFHLITNTFSYFVMPDLYTKTWDGFLQAQWSGPAGYEPTWIFLRNLVASNMIFTALFMLAIQRCSPYTLRPRNELIKG